MIPKKIHYCWFGGNKMPEIAEKCIESWKKYCPGYEIICWNESNCDLSVNTFVKQAAENNKWAFVSDYFRLKIIEEQGGIYLDIDVELLKPLDDLTLYEGFMGFELAETSYINSGLGFGAIANNKIIRMLRQNYENISFIKLDGTFDMKPCPQRDTRILVNLGLKQNNKTQMIDDFIFFSSDYFSPIGFTGERFFSENTYSIHHFNGSWLEGDQLAMLELRKKTRMKYGKIFGFYIFKILYIKKFIKKNGLLKLYFKAIDKIKYK